MKTKSLLISAVMIILALSCIGTAFATKMDFFNVGVLSSGKVELLQVNTDHVGFLPAADGSGIDKVALSFDLDLTAGSTIWVTVNDDFHGLKVLDGPLGNSNEVIINLDQIIVAEDLGSSTVNVTVAER